MTSSFPRPPLILKLGSAKQVVHTAGVHLDCLTDMLLVLCKYLFSKGRAVSLFVAIAVDSVTRHAMRTRSIARHMTTKHDCKETKWCFK